MTLCQLFLGCLKAIYTVLNESLLLNFLVHKYTFYGIFSPKKMSRRNLSENLLRPWSGSGRFQKPYPDPVKNRPDPQQWLRQCDNFILLLSLACAGGHLAVVEVLLQHGADPFHKLKVHKHYYF
jgi:hypothetical protein